MDELAANFNFDRWYSEIAHSRNRKARKYVLRRKDQTIEEAGDGFDVLHRRVESTREGIQLAEEQWRSHLTQKWTHGASSIREADAAAAVRAAPRAPSTLPPGLASDIQLAESEERSCVERTQVGWWTQLMENEDREERRLRLRLAAQEESHVDATEMLPEAAAFIRPLPHQLADGSAHTGAGSDPAEDSDNSSFLLATEDMIAEQRSLMMQETVQRGAVERAGGQWLSAIMDRHSYAVRSWMKEAAACERKSARRDIRNVVDPFLRAEASNRAAVQDAEMQFRRRIETEARAKASCRVLALRQEAASARTAGDHAVAALIREEAGDRFQIASAEEGWRARLEDERRREQLLWNRPASRQREPASVASTPQAAPSPVASTAATASGEGELPPSAVDALVKEQGEGRRAIRQAEHAWFSNMQQAHTFALAASLAIDEERRVTLEKLHRRQTGSLMRAEHKIRQELEDHALKWYEHWEHQEAREAITAPVRYARPVSPPKNAIPVALMAELLVVDGKERRMREAIQQSEDQWRRYTMSQHHAMVKALSADNSVVLRALEEDELRQRSQSVQAEERWRAHLLEKCRLGLVRHPDP